MPSILNIYLVNATMHTQASYKLNAYHNELQSGKLCQWSVLISTNDEVFNSQMWMTLKKQIHMSCVHNIECLGSCYSTKIFSTVLYAYSTCLSWLKAE